MNVNKARRNVFDALVGDAGCEEVALFGEFPPLIRQVDSSFRNFHRHVVRHMPSSSEFPTLFAAIIHAFTL